MPFWTASLYIMAHLFIRNDDQKLSTWLILGLMIGLATLCKVHGLYLWAGFGLFLIITRAKWLLNWRLYMGVAVTALCVLPIIYWNVINDFITYRYHSERVTHTTLQWNMLGREIAGEFLYQNPVISILIAFAIIAMLRRRIRFNRKKASTWLLCMSLPMILIFWGISLTNATLPHWSGPGYIPLFFVGALYLEQRSYKTIPGFIKVAGSVLIILLVAGVGLIRLSPVNFGSHDKLNYGEYCPTLDLTGWQSFSKAFAVQEQKDVADGSMKAYSPLIVDKWFPGGHLEFYTTRETGLPVIGIGQLDQLHKFAWLNKVRPLHLGDDAYAIVPSNLPLNVKEAYGKYFTSIDNPVVFDQVRSGGVVRHFYVYRMKGFKLAANENILAIKNEDSVSEDVTRLVGDLQLVKDEMNRVDSLSNHERRISLTTRLEDKAKNIYLVKVGENNGTGSVTYFTFLVDANKMQVLNPNGKIEGQK
jgi:hypothetical protein